jgi:hypothetical protein
MLALSFSHFSATNALSDSVASRNSQLDRRSWTRKISACSVVRCLCSRPFSIPFRMYPGIPKIADDVSSMFYAAVSNSTDLPSSGSQNLRDLFRCPSQIQVGLLASPRDMDASRGLQTRHRNPRQIPVTIFSPFA